MPPDVRSCVARSVIEIVDRDQLLLSHPGAIWSSCLSLAHLERSVRQLGAGAFSGGFR